MRRITLTRKVHIPDALRLARCVAVPQLGPSVLFFSGGNALKGLSQALIRYTHNSTHLITPFDSGGSSAVIRKAFDMLSVGDLRNRIMALADQSVRGNPAIYELFALRLPTDAEPRELHRQLDRLVAGRHRLAQRVEQPMLRIILNHLHYFRKRMPANFDLRGASVGNLILAGGYLNNRRHISPVVYMFSKLVEARGTVKPITGLNYHLVARLTDGRVLVGQHLMTGKEVAPIDAPIEEIFLCPSLDDLTPVEVRARRKVTDLIRQADLLCYPFGSFYSSVVPNLLPQGVGAAIAASDAPKVFIPNPAGDPEQLGMSLSATVDALVAYAQRSCDEPVAPADLLGFVVIDSKRADYTRPFGIRRLREQGIQVIDTRLVTERSAPLLDEEKVIEVLLSLC